MAKKKKNDLDVLTELKDSLSRDDLDLTVQNATISNPTKAVEDALKDFITKKLYRIESDNQFGDYIKQAIMARIGEFDIDQLIKLMGQISRDNNIATAEMSKLFIGDATGKTVLNHLKDNAVATSAQIVYDNADKETLQALTYFTSMLGKAVSRQQTLEVKAESSGN